VYVYFDESLPQRRTSVTVAGALATEDNWEWLIDDWGLVLRKPEYGVERFHAYDFFAREKAFEGWGRAKADEFLGELIETTRNRLIGVVGAQFPFGTGRSAIAKAYAASAFQGIAEALNAASVGNSDPLNVILADNSYLKKGRLRDEWERTTSPLTAKGQVGFSKPEWNEALQLADLIANQVSRWSGAPNKMSPELARLYTMHPFYVTFATEPVSPIGIQSPRRKR
jgi:hypothetical protein